MSSKVAAGQKLVQWMVSARWIVPVVPDVEYENHSLIVNDGKIVDILPTEEANQQYTTTAEGRVDLPDHVLLPGLINMHTHSAMTLCRSIVDDVDLHTWLNDYIWPTESKFVSEEFCRAGVEKACVEMLRSGTTCFNDMYFYPEITAKVAKRCGMRAAVGVPIINVPTNWAATPQIALEQFEKLHEEYKDHPTIQVTLAPHAPYTVTDELFTRCRELSEEKKVLIHTHLHESPTEIDSQEERPFNRLDKLGLINDRAILVHMTQVNEKEIERVQEAQIAGLVHCPESNLKLGSGICPVSSLGTTNVCVGTDGASSNDDLDLLGEMRTACLLDNMRSQMQLGSLQKSVNTKEWIRTVTINGAKALKIDNIVGSLEKGKDADFIAIKINALPVYDVQYTLVLSGTNPVTDVWVGGNSLLRDGEVLVIDEKKVNENAIAWGEKIKQGLPQNTDSEKSTK